MKKFLILIFFTLLFLFNLAYGVEISVTPSLTLNDINRVGRILNHDELEIGFYSGLINFYVAYGVYNKREFQLSAGKNCGFFLLPFSIKNMTNVIEFVTLRNIYRSNFLEINTASSVGVLIGDIERYLGYFSSCSLIFNINPIPFAGISFPFSIYHIGNNYGGTWSSGYVIVPGIYLTFSVKIFSFKFGYNIASYPDLYYLSNMIFQEEPFEPVKIGDVLISPISMSFELSFNF